MSVLVWVMMGVALWHFAVFMPDRFYGGIIGALAATVVGSTVSGLAAAGFAVPSDNPPGLIHAIAAIPGGLLSLLVSYQYGSYVESRPAIPETGSRRSRWRRRPRRPRPGTPC